VYNKLSFKFYFDYVTETCDLEIVGKPCNASVWYLQIIFPNMDVIKLLLECGAPVNARNESRSTPLHVAANPYNFYSPVST
jgi:ankyrin repeat protein